MTERLFMGASAIVSLAIGLLGGATAFGAPSLALPGIFAGGWGYVAFRRVRQ